MSRRPNIVLVIADQLRAFETGCYGNEVIRTPNLDQLAREGVRFETAVTNAPVCMAARSVLLSGQHNRTATGGVSNVHFPTWPGDAAMPEYPFPGRPHLREGTLPEALRDLGYHTEVIGKWHIHSWPHDVGFARSVIPRVHHCHSGQHFSRDGGPEFVPESWSVDFEAAEVERFLAERAGAEEPFFLYYSISPPHCPLADAPERILRMYDPAEIPLRANVDPERPLANADYWLRVYRWDFRYYHLRLPYTEELPEGYGIRELTAEYYGLTTWMDEALGRMLHALERTGMAEDTIVVFCADHGDNLGSHGLVQKGGPNEESVRIPLVVRHPARLSPRVVRDEVASLVDLAPTLLEMAGGSPPAHMQGRSLLGSCEGAGASDACAVIEAGGGVCARSASHSVFVPYETGSRRLAAAPTRVHELASDPWEFTNLAGDPEPDAETRRLEAKLRRWDSETPWMAPEAGTEP